MTQAGGGKVTALNYRKYLENTDQIIIVLKYKKVLKYFVLVLVLCVMKLTLKLMLS